MAPASRLGALRTGEGSHGARRSRRSGPSVAGPGRGRLSVVRRRSAVENRPVQRSSPVTPLQQNTSAASLSVLAHSPVARDAKANFVSFVPFRACCEEPGWGGVGGPVVCSQGARVYGPSLPDLLHLRYHDHCYGSSLVTPWVRGPMLGLGDANRFKTRCAFDTVYL